MIPMAGITALLMSVTAENEMNAVLKAQKLSLACELYYLDPNSNGRYPKQLDDLVKPPWGGASFLKNGKKDLLDPWGQKYKLGVHFNRDGFAIPCIWTERTINGKLRAFGQKPGENKP